MDKFYLLGYPLSHSYSPFIYRRLFKLIKRDATYLLLETKRERFFDSLYKILRDRNTRGFNLTQPFKEMILEMDVEPVGVSKEIGSINCVKVKGKKLYGFNTDYLGFKRSLTPFINKIRGEIGFVFGAGGASKAVVKALIDVGISFVFVANRTYKRAERFKDIFGERIYPLSLKDAPLFIKRAKIVVNATTVGLNKGERIIDPSWIDRDMILYDLIYNPKETDFIKAGKRIGAKVKNGFSMLYFQCTENIRVWYGGENG